MQKDFYSEYFVIEDKHWWFVGRRRLLLRVLNRFLGPSQERRRVLDVGCGTGTMLGYLSRYGDAQGADADPRAVEFCKQRQLENVTQLKDNRLPFPDESFDVITMLDVLEHIDDDAFALQEVRRVLRRDGLVIITVPAYQLLWGAQDIISHHKRRYVARELSSRLENAALRVKKISYFNFMLFPIIAVIRVFRRLFTKPPSEGDVSSDFSMTHPGLANNFLSMIFSIEALFINKINFPFGVSILGVAQKTTPQEQIR